MKMKRNRKTLEKNQWSQKLILRPNSSDLRVDIQINSIELRVWGGKTLHYCHFIFSKDAKTMVKESSFNRWCWYKWIFMYERMKLDPYLTNNLKMNWKMDQRPIFNSKNYKTIRRKQRCKSLRLCIRQWLFRFDTKSTVKK